jgi:hypothetical protein
MDHSVLNWASTVATKTPLVPYHRRGSSSEFRYQYIRNVQDEMFLLLIKELPVASERDDAVVPGTRLRF